MREQVGLNVRLKRQVWTFLKNYAMNHDKSMNEVINDLILKLKEKEEKSSCK